MLNFHVVYYCQRFKLLSKVDEEKSNPRSLVEVSSAPYSYTVYRMIKQNLLIIMTCNKIIFQ